MSYRCVCKTCRQEAVRDCWESANDFFQDHADRGHRVEIVQQGDEGARSDEA